MQTLTKPVHVQPVFHAVEEVAPARFRGIAWTVVDGVRYEVRCSKPRAKEHTYTNLKLRLRQLVGQRLPSDFVWKTLKLNSPISGGRS